MTRAFSIRFFGPLNHQFLMIQQAFSLVQTGEDVIEFFIRSTPVVSLHIA